MDFYNGFNNGLGSLPVLTNAVTRSVSAENPTGERGKGGMAVPDINNPSLPHSGAAMDLGRGWKVNPFLKVISGETVTLMDVKGPGIIQHIWLTTEQNRAGNGRGCILRFYWDNEKNPSVEVPLTDFFAVGHDIFAPVNSLAVTVNPESALNCYWPMPFKESCRITFTNELKRDLEIVAYQITYVEADIFDNTGYFHAQWRRSMTSRKNPEYTIIDNIKGDGKYVGTFLAWTQLSDGWFGEGEIKFFMDGDKDFPTICGTGTEDYFCGSYEFPKVFNTAYAGSTLNHPGKTGPPKWSLYRWHIMDPICFHQDLKVTIQALGWWPDEKFKPLEDDIASVAYWYQTEPHVDFPLFPELSERLPR